MFNFLHKTTFDEFNLEIETNKLQNTLSSEIDAKDYVFNAQQLQKKLKFMERLDLLAKSQFESKGGDIVLLKVGNVEIMARRSICPVLGETFTYTVNQ